MNKPWLKEGFKTRTEWIISRKIVKILTPFCQCKREWILNCATMYPGGCAAKESS